MRRVSLFLCCLLIGLLTSVEGFVIAPSAVAASSCDEVLFQEDAAASGLSCPNLPPLSATGLVLPELPTGAQKARVRDIVDGDTIKVSIGDNTFTVRIIGVDTPETVDPNTPDECYGAEASSYTAQLIPVDTLIWLDKDVSDTDRYGRSLRSVWFAQGEGRYRLLGDALIRDGYAVLDTFPPDVEYVDRLTLAQDDAVAASRGLWSSCGGADTPLVSPTPTNVPVSDIQSSAAPPPALAANCDPSYPNVCIPSPSADLDCGDIGYRRFQVLPPDPHGFDGDSDGIGCESG